MKTTLIALAAGYAVLAAAPATAQKTVSVPYADLNLSTVPGQQALERRLDRAARGVCDYDAEQTGTRIRSTEAARCYAQVKAAAKERFAAIVGDNKLGG